MSDSVTGGTPIRQVSVALENRVGALSELVNLLRHAHVEVLGFCVVDSADLTIIRLVVTDYDSVVQFFQEQGIAHSSVEVVVAELKSGAEGFGDCLEILLRGETNIHFSYPLLTQPGRYPLIAFHLEDCDFGTSILHKNGFRTYYQEDLGR